MSKQTEKVKRNHLPHYGRRLTGNALSTVSFGAQSLIIGYMSFYLTDSVYLSAGMVGLIVGLSRIFDGISDIIAGLIIDRTNSKWGKGRPYSLCIPLMWIAVVLLFSVPDLSTTGKAVYVFIMYNLSDTVFRTLTMTAGPIYTKRAYTEDEQLDIVGISGLVAGVANMIVAVIMPVLIDSIGSSKGGWTIIALVFAIPCGIMGILQFVLVPELDMADVAAAKKQQKIPVREALDSLFHNKYIILFFFACLARSIITGMSMGTYYFTYVVGNLSVYSIVSMFSIISMVIMPFIPAMTRKLGLRRYMFIFMAAAAAAYFMIYISPRNLAILSISAAVTLVGSLPQSMLGNLVAIQCIKYSEWKDGREVGGIIGSMNSLASKLGTALGAIIVGAVLGLVGYDGALEVQSTAANSAITFLYAGFPGILTALSALLINFYRLDEKMPQIEAELAERKRNWG